MITARTTALEDQFLDNETISETLYTGLGDQMEGQRVLVLIPDHTRSLPLASLFKALVEVLKNTRQLDFMVALGTHPPLSKAKLFQLVGITAVERSTTYKHIGFFNHTWAESDALEQIGTITTDELRDFAGEKWHPSLGGDVPIRINKLALSYDRIIILGPTFPHEVVGFSGGAKYLFPGISGPEMIHVTHWLGALMGVQEIIGVKDTPVRTMIHKAAGKLPTPVTLVALVVGNGLVGMFIGDILGAWSAAADLSQHHHIRWCSQTYRQVLSCPAPMYDELWTASKAMYKLEPALADGGEIILYAPHLDTVSRMHGRYLYEIGYHILPYFLKNWERYQHVPLGVLAHSTHLRGAGKMINGIEKPNFRVVLASKISPQECAQLNLGYQDPTKINPKDFMGQEDSGILYVPKAGETLYRLKESSPGQPCV